MKLCKDCENSIPMQVTHGVEYECKHSGTTVFDYISGKSLTVYKNCREYRPFVCNIEDACFFEHKKPKTWKFWKL